MARPFCRVRTGKTATSDRGTPIASIAFDGELADVLNERCEQMVIGGGLLTLLLIIVLLLILF